MNDIEDPVPPAAQTTAAGPTAQMTQEQAEQQAEQQAEEQAEEQAEKKPGRMSRLRHRVFGLRAVAAVALASLIIGGLGGAALSTLLSDDREAPGGPGGQRVPGDGRHPQPADGDGFRSRQPGGGLPPGTAPQDDVQPEDGATQESGDTNA